MFKIATPNDMKFPQVSLRRVECIYFGKFNRFWRFLNDLFFNRALKFETFSIFAVIVSQNFQLSVKGLEFSIRFKQHSFVHTCGWTFLKIGLHNFGF